MLPVVRQAFSIAPSWPVRSIPGKVLQHVGILLAIALVTLQGSRQAHAQIATLPLLTRAQEIRHLSPEEANRHYPVKLRGVVTYKEASGLFLQDSTAGIWVETPSPLPSLRAGLLIEFEGSSECPDFAPQIRALQARVLGPAPFPTPKKPTFEQMASTEEDSQWVEIEGVVRAPTRIQDNPALDVAISGGRVLAIIPNLAPSESPRLVDARVRLRGACGALFNAKNHWVGVLVYVPALDQLEVVKPAPADAFSIRLRPIVSLLRFNLAGTGGHRVRIQGVVTAHQSGHRLTVVDETEDILVHMRQDTAVQPGDQVDVVGFLQLVPTLKRWRMQRSACSARVHCPPPRRSLRSRFLAEITIRRW